MYTCTAIWGHTESLIAATVAILIKKFLLVDLGDFLLGFWVGIFIIVLKISAFFQVGMIF